MRLYSSELSPNSMKVRTLAVELGIELDIQEVDLFAGGTRTEEFRALNPNGKVPVLKDGDFVLTESNAILGYLASKRPEAGLYPDDARTHSDIDRWLFWQIAHFSRPVAKVAFERIGKLVLKRDDIDEAVIAEGNKEFIPFGRVLNAQLDGREWIVGSLSIADFAVGAWGYIANRIEMLGDYPHIRSWVARLTARDSWKRTTAFWDEIH